MGQTRGITATGHSSLPATQVYYADILNPSISNVFSENSSNLISKQSFRYQSVNVLERSFIPIKLL